MRRNNWVNLFGSALHHQIKGELDLIDQDWNIPPEYPDPTGYKDVAVDLETYDPNIKTLGPGWARKTDTSSDSCSSRGIQRILSHTPRELTQSRSEVHTQVAEEQMQSDMNVIMHNATYDAGWMRAEGIEIKGRIIDTMITGALVDENRWSFGLDAMARDFVQLRKDEKLLQAAAKEWGVDPKAEMYKLPPKYVGSYAEQDAVATLKLWEALKVQLEEQELWHIWNVETDLIRCMLDMRTNGVRVDLDKAEINKKIIKEKMVVLRLPQP